MPTAGLVALGFAAWAVAAGEPAEGAGINTVFVIAMENHNWTQPSSDGSAPAQIFNNSSAPFINSIVNSSFNGGALNPQATLFGTSTPISIHSQVSYASAYHNVLSTPTGVGAADIHPSEPNYVWAEAGSNLGVLNDNTPYGSGGTDQTTTAHLTGYMEQKGETWKSYQEDIDTSSTGAVLPKSQWISPINSHAGTYTTVANHYNGSLAYDYEPKHNPMIFFGDTNGGNNATSSNPAAANYAPLQQLQTDLTNNTVAQYNWITPNLDNDMHDGTIAEGDHFLATIIPEIMASEAYKNGGAIVIWTDESEGTNPNDYNHTLMEIVISPLAKGNGYDSTLNYTHSSDLKTMQEIFQAGPLLGDAGAAGTNDLSDMFLPGIIPATVPEPSTLALCGLGAVFICLARVCRRV